MKKAISLITVITLFLLFVNSCKIDEGDSPTSPSGSEISISGQVVDALTNEALSQAEVRILDGNTQLGYTSTDQDGNYSIKVEIDADKVLNIQVTLSGYSTQTIPVNAVMDQNLEVAVIKLGSTSVESGVAIVTGRVYDKKYGTPIENAEIKFYYSGNIISAASTDQNGSFTDSIFMDGIKELTALTTKAAYVADTSIVTAEAGAVKVIEDIGLYPLSSMIVGDAASVYLYSQTFETIGVSESGSPETAQITFEVQDSSGNPIDLDHQVTVKFRFGSSPNGGEILAPGSVDTDASGQAIVSLTSGTKAGVVQIIAEINSNGQTILSKPVSITIHGGLPNLDHFSIGSEKRNYPYYNTINNAAKIAVLVGDKYSNPVRPGTAVYFSSDAGVIQGSALTNELGVAGATLLSGSPKPDDPVYGKGYFYAHASTIDENENSIEVNTLVLFSGSPIITNVSPTAVDVPNGGSQFFNYSVMDENGNPLAEGNKYNVSIETNGDAEVMGDVAVVMEDVQFGNTSFGFTVFDADTTYNPNPITITIDVDGPNGKARRTIEGITR